MAYSSLAKEQEFTKHIDTADLYSNLAEQFVILMDIMHCMREYPSGFSSLDISQAEELWDDTRSLHALNVLKNKDNYLASKNLVPGNLFPLIRH